MDDPLTTRIQVRFRDLDPMRHVNNAVYMSYLEEARAHYFRTVLDRELEAVDTVLATITVDFEREISREDDVEVTIRVPELGESSIPMEYEIRSNGEIAAEAETVQVLVGEDGARPLPEEWREAIESHEDL